MSPNTNERLAVLETKVTNIENGMTRIESKLDVFQETFATKEEQKQNVSKIDAIDKSIS
jgi:exonuclease VII small subunit